MSGLKKRVMAHAASVIIICVVGMQASLRAQSPERPLNRTRALIAEVVNASYPEFKDEMIAIETFSSDSNFFKAQFSVTRFLTFRGLRYKILVNPRVFASGLSDEALRAVLAHEFAHFLYYDRKNCLELIGLAALADKSFAAKFERKADLEAISRGYGEGLKQFREWLYLKIPAEKVKSKRRDYFSPEEIDLILDAIVKRPEMIEIWRRKVPRSIDDIAASIR